MSDTLSRIVRGKEAEVERRKQEKKISDFEASSFFNRVGKSLANTLKSANKPAIIAEFIQKAPNTELFNDNANVQEVVRGYVAAGAVGIVVVTEKEYFAGKLADLKMARQVTESPLIRKDYIFDVFQLFEAKANGADAVILLANTLTAEQVLELSKQAKELGLEVIVQVDTAEQLNVLNEFVSIVAVNVQTVDETVPTIDRAITLSKEVPSQFVKIVSGGISTHEQIQQLYNLGYKGFVVGEHFMKQENPAVEAEQFIQAL